MPMRPEFKPKILEALRSRKYPQTTQCLHDNRGFCCLGVICDITDPNSWSEAEENQYWFEYRSEKEDGLLPVRLREELNITTDEQYALTRMNDTDVPFTKIADWIEENL